MRRSVTVKMPYGSACDIPESRIARPIPVVA